MMKNYVGDAAASCARDDSFHHKKRFQQRPLWAMASKLAVPADHVDLETASTEDGLSEPEKIVEGAQGGSKAEQGSGKGSEGTSGVAGLFRSGGVLPSAICLSKAGIGAGILSISVHAAEVGALYQLGCLLIGAVLTVASIRMISVASVETKSWSFEDLCESLFHPSMSFITGFMNTCNCLGAAAGYLIVCGQVFVVIFDADQRARNIFVVLVGIFVCCPMALARDIGFMRHLAALSVAALAFLVIVVGSYLGQSGVNESVTPETFLFGPGHATMLSYMGAINNMVFAYNNQFNVPQLTGEITPEPSVKRMMRVALLSSGLSFVLYATVSILGVLAFGVAEGQKDSLILDLMPVRKQVLVVISLASVMYSVLTCFQFHIYPVRQFLAYAVRKARGRDADAEATDVVVYGRSMTRWYDIFGAIASVALVVLVAVVITSLRDMLDFIGAFASAYISFIVPPLWILALRRRDTKSFSWFTREILLTLAFLALGIFLFVFGTYTAIKQILGVA